MQHYPAARIRNAETDITVVGQKIIEPNSLPGSKLHAINDLAIACYRTARFIPKRQTWGGRQVVNLKTEVLRDVQIAME
jgi:hypothetical protein